MPIEIRHMRYAVEVADCGSFSRAASKLGIETSALSRGVRDLEDLLGVTVFERHPRGVRATEAGSEFINEARSILGRLAAAQARAREAGAGKHGHLSLGYIWSFARGVAAELVGRFKLENAGAALHLIEDGPEALLHRLAQWEVDLVLTATPKLDRMIVAGLNDLGKMPLWTERLFAMVPTSEPGSELNWVDLAAQDILYRRADAAAAFTQWVEDIGGPHLQFQAQDCSFDGLVTLVAAGEGRALVPSSLAQSDLATVRFVPVNASGAELQVVALWRRANDNPSMRRFLALAKRLYEQPPLNPPIDHGASSRSRDR
jgi:DNA-binding transcriptional LysR family regulator